MVEDISSTMYASGLKGGQTWWKRRINHAYEFERSNGSKSKFQTDSKRTGNIFDGKYVYVYVSLVFRHVHAITLEEARPILGTMILLSNLKPVNLRLLFFRRRRNL